MNKERRKQIAEAQKLIGQAKDLIEEICSDEQEYYDNMPESLQNGEKGERAYNATSNLQEVVDNLETAVDTLEECLA